MNDLNENTYPAEQLEHERELLEEHKAAATDEERETALLGRISHLDQGIRLISRELFNMMDCLGSGHREGVYSSLTEARELLDRIEYLVNQADEVRQAWGEAEKKKAVEHDDA